MQNPDPVKIAIAENSMIIRNGIVATLKDIPDYNIFTIEIQETDNLRDCLSIHKPDILISNPSLFALADIERLKKELELSALKCVALITCNNESSLYIEYDSLIHLNDTQQEFENKLLTLFAPLQKEEEVSNGQETLSSREKEIIVCIAKGMANKEIADALFLSPHTVITHRRNITRKLQIHSPAGLTIYAIVNKLIEIQDIKNNLI